jgi:hypothetical protein
VAAIAHRVLGEAMKRQSKYKSVPTFVGDIRFASKAEAKRYEELRLMLSAGLITKLRIQPRYELHVDGIKIGEYRPDFDYCEGAELKVEDVKGVRTDLFIWKKKHFEAQYKIPVIEITRGGKVRTWLDKIAANDQKKINRSKP